MERYRLVPLRSQSSWMHQPINDHYAICIGGRGGQVVAEPLNLNSYQADLLAELLRQEYQRGFEEGSGLNG